MTIGVLGETLSPQSDDERRFILLLEGGNIRPEFSKEVLRLITNATHEAAVGTIPSVEREPDRRVTFAEAGKILEGKLDLEGARTNAVKSHGRWGLVNALVKAGVVKDIAAYSALFDKATISEADLRKVRESLDRGEKLLPIFDAGAMTPDRLFAVLFKEGGVPHHPSEVEKLATIRRIDPKDIPNLANLAGKPYYEIIDAFKAAYKEANPLKPTGPRVLFTTDKLEPTCTVDVFAVKDMQALAKGEISFLDPNADFLRFRAQMDAGLRKIAGKHDNFDGMSDEDYRAFLDKAFAEMTIDEYMPDCQKNTRYPNYIFKSGLCVAILFDPHARKLTTFGPNPHMYSAEGNNGSRISLG